MLEDSLKNKKGTTKKEIDKSLCCAFFFFFPSVINCSANTGQVVSYIMRTTLAVKQSFSYIYTWRMLALLLNFLRWSFVAVSRLVKKTKGLYFGGGNIIKDLILERGAAVVGPVGALPVDEDQPSAHW